MARMIPAEIYPGCASPGEREIFKRLRDDPGTGSWTILHSLNIAKHSRQVSGECDFAIIIPSKGVVCLEIKACRSLRRDSGGWYYGTSAKPDLRGPFRQASDAMHSLRGTVAEKRPDLSRVVFWSAVAFSHVEFSASSVEWHDWQVIDVKALRSRPISALLNKLLERARDLLSECQTASWFHPESGEPYPDQCEALVQQLRPDFEFFESPRVRAERQTAELKFFTTEQSSALDAMASNSRVVFKGPAGTGKTLLAIESARRSASAGNRALFICFNQFLGRWLRDETASLSPLVTTSTLHSQMLSIAGVSPPFMPDSSFWSEELPKKAIETLLRQNDGEACFEEIIVDEAQDVTRDAYLDFLDLSLHGGLASGRWQMFGDFEKQALYGAANVSLYELLSQRTQASVFSLRTNCRNPPRIAELVYLLGGLSPNYSRVLRPDNGVEAELHYYSDVKEQVGELTTILEGLYERGYRGNEIVVLSARAVDRSAAVSVQTSPWKDRLSPYESRRGDLIGYCTVHAFKGLEASVVVVTDLNTVAGSEAQVVFYIAATRALDRLILLVHENVKREIARVLLQSPST